MPAPVTRNASVAVRCEEEHLSSQASAFSGQPWEKVTGCLTGPNLYNRFQCHLWFLWWPWRVYSVYGWTPTVLLSVEILCSDDSSSECRGSGLKIEKELLAAWEG